MSFQAQTPQFPLNIGGARGQQAFIGIHQLNFIGSGLITHRIVGPTGVATGFASGGLPAVTATLLSAGNYDIRFPTAQAVNINPVVYGPSGQLFRAHIVRGRQGLDATASGTAILQTFTPSGVVGNMPTGTTIVMRFNVAPITAF